MTARTASLRQADFNSAQAALTKAACSAAAAAGAGAPRCVLTVLPPPAGDALKGFQLELTVTFRAADGSSVLARFKPPPLPPTAGRVVWSQGPATCQLRWPALPKGQGPLRSNGTHVVLSNGQAWTGVGVNLVDDYKDGWCQGEWPLSKQETLRRLTIATDCLGAQWVRYTVVDGLVEWKDNWPSVYKEDVTFVENPRRLDILDALVNLAGQKGIFFEITLLLSWSLTNPASPGRPGQQLGWPTPATATFWKAIAKRYANVPHVFFGLLNEPYENHDGQYDAAYTAAVQPIVDAIRSTGARNLISIGGSRSWARYADSFLQYPIRDSNWAAALHLYVKAEEFEATTAYCRKRPCIVEEFGPEESKALIALMKKRGLPFAGWICDEDAGPQMLLAPEGNVDYCYDNRPLRLSPWGRVMQAATGTSKTCAMLSPSS